MELLYMIFIYPLEVLMKLILEGLLSISASPFLSLVGLSLSVTIISFPLSHLAEKLQKNERNIQNILKPKIREFKQVFKGSALNTYLSTLYRQNNYHPVYSLRSSFGLLIQIPFFFAAYHFIANYDVFFGTASIFFSDLGKPDALLKMGSFSINIMPFVMTGVNMLSSLVYGKNFSVKENIQLYGISILFFVVLYNAPSALLIYWTANNLFSLIKNIIYKKFESPEQKPEKIKNNNKELSLLFTFASLSLGILLFIAGPSMLLASGSASDIDGTFSQFFYFQLMLMTSYLVVILLLHYYLSRRFKKIMTGIISCLSIYTLINAFAFSGDYGDISNFFFENGIKTTTVMTVINIATLIIVVVTISTLFYFRKTKLIFYFFAISTLSLLLLSYNEGTDFYSKIKDQQNEEAKELDKKFTFSTKKNVVVIMMDRFIGGYVPKVLELYPELNSIMDGFEWYSNSLSSGSDTLSSEPSIMGGWDYHADHINKTRKNVLLMDKLDESLRILPYNFTKAGYRSSLYARLSSWIKSSDKTHLKNTVVENLTGKYSEIWLKEKNREMDKNDSVAKLSMFGLFRISPPFARNLIYDNGNWLLYGNLKKKQKVERDKYFVSFIETNKNLKRNFYKNWSTLDYLPELSEVSDKSKPQFFYFSSKLTHEPWLTTSAFGTSFDGKIKYPINIYNQFKKSMNSLKHLYTDTAALKLLGEWFSWMKTNGVYDNTRIIIVSDHGRRVYNPFFKKKIIPGSKKKNTPAFWHNVLLVKDFDSHGEITRNAKFMTSCDIPYLALKGIIDGENPYTGNPIVEKTDKIPFVISRTKFRIKEQKKYKYNITESFNIIDENIFDLSNWKRVKN